MQKRTFGILAVCFISLLITAITATPVFAAEQVGYHHDAQTDTSDYCLSVHDVSLDLSEIRECAGDEKAIQKKIIEAAAPAALVRDNEIPSSNWERLSTDRLKFDFSQFVPEQSEKGYPVTVFAPAIMLDKPSQISFRVYVTDQNPPVYAIIRFAQTDLPDLELDVTDGATLSYSALKVPVKNGSTFLGWYLNQACTDPFLLPDNKDFSEQKISGDMTLYPKWEKNKVYATVHFAGGEFPDITLDITQSVALTLKDVGIPVKDGCSFAGWYLDPDFTVPFLLVGQAESEAQTVRGNITLCGKWNPVTPVPVDPPQQPTAPDGSSIATDEDFSSSEEEVIKEEKEAIPMFEFMTLAALVAGAIGFGLNVAADVRVLNWYRKKKKAFLATMGTTL